MAALTFAQISRGLTLVGRWGLDWLIPPQCLACRGEVAEASGLCVRCWSKLSFIEPPFCDRLAIPFPYDQGQGALSAAALADPPPWEQARAAVLFDDAAQGLVHALKYRDRHEAGILMARLMRRAGADLLAGADGVVPVPLHRFRLWRRRYNQSAILARHVAKASGTPFRPRLLRRLRATRSQTGLDREERRRNVRDAFIVPEEAGPLVAGKSFVLIDDVRTTGATLEACTKALRKAGAARIGVLTFALVDKPRQLHI
ncbi:MAG: ComF family protein [Parvibaculaceae bacterium]